MLRWESFSCNCFTASRAIGTGTCPHVSIILLTPNLPPWSLLSGTCLLLQQILHVVKRCPHAAFHLFPSPTAGSLYCSIHSSHGSAAQKRLKAASLSWVCTLSCHLAALPPRLPWLYGAGRGWLPQANGAARCAASGCSLTGWGLTRLPASAPAACAAPAARNCGQARRFLPAPQVPSLRLSSPRQEVSALVPLMPCPQGADHLDSPGSAACPNPSSFTVAARSQCQANDP